VIESPGESFDRRRHELSVDHYLETLSLGLNGLAASVERMMAHIEATKPKPRRKRTKAVAVRKPVHRRVKKGAA